MKKLIAGSIAAVAVLLFPAVSFASVSITVNGANPATVSVGHSFNDPGVTAISTVDGDISSSVISTGVDTSSIGVQSDIYSVIDSALDTASAVRTVDVIGGGAGQLWCSGPTAPGWNTNLPDGGCGHHVDSGSLLLFGSTSFICPAWYPAGCVIK